MTAYAGPDLLDAGHVIDRFDCGDDTLNAWLTRHALANQTVGNTRTWIVTDDAGHVVAYYASCTAVVLRADGAKARMRRNAPDPMPALLLARLAVDRKHQGGGLGAALLKHFVVKAIDIAAMTGVRILLVHAANADAAALYERHGFERSPVDELTMMMLLQDVIASA